MESSAQRRMPLDQRFAYIAQYTAVQVIDAYGERKIVGSACRSQLMQKPERPLALREREFQDLGGCRNSTPLVERRFQKFSSQLPNGYFLQKTHSRNTYAQLCLDRMFNFNRRQ